MGYLVAGIIGFVLARILYEVIVRITEGHTEPVATCEKCRLREEAEKAAEEAPHQPGCEAPNRDWCDCPRKETDDKHEIIEDRSTDTGEYSTFDPPRTED
jgi:hypothetical protein